MKGETTADRFGGPGAGDGGATRADAGAVSGVVRWLPMSHDDTTERTEGTHETNSVGGNDRADDGAGNGNRGEPPADASGAGGGRRVPLVSGQVLTPESSDIARFLARIRFTPGGCWEWSGALNNRGYGQFQIPGRCNYAHRFAYEEWVDDIPAGLELDHLCRNRACCNPAHLEPVTRSENVRRGLMARLSTDVDGLRTHCINGHPFNDENTYIRPDNGKRACRACKRERMRVYKARERAA